MHHPRLARRLALPAIAVGIATLIPSGHGASAQGPSLPTRYQFMVGQDKPGYPFTSVTSVDVGPDGLVYVADWASSRVFRLGPEGGLINAWGGRGSGAGRFVEPSGIAVAPDGTVFVSDAGNDRIQYFTSWGEYVGQWGRPGAGPGEFGYTNGITVAPDGSVYVADKERQQVTHFDPRGTFLGEFAAPGSNDVAVAPDGRIYVAGAAASRISVFDPLGRPVGGWDIPRCFADSFRLGPVEYGCGPNAIAIGSDGNVYASGGYDGVGRFDLEGQRLGRAAGGQVSGVALSADLVVYVAHSQYLVAYHQGRSLGAITTLGADGPGLTAPIDVDLGADGTAYVVDRVTHHVHVLNPDGSAAAEWGDGQGWGDGLLHEPGGVLVAPDGSILVSDTRNGRIVRFDREGRWLGVVLGKGILAPLGLAAGFDGLMAVADGGGMGRVVWFDLSGHVVASTPVAKIPAITDVAALPDGRYLAATGEGGQIMVIAKDRSISAWGEAAHIAWPVGLAVAGNEVLVTDLRVSVSGLAGSRPAVSRFSLDGSFIEVLDAGSCSPTSSSMLGGLVIAADGRVLVADASGGRLLRFDPGAGTTDAVTGLLPPGDGQFKSPDAVAARAGKVFVADSGNSRVQVLGPRGELEGTWRSGDCSGAPPGEIADAALASDGSVVLADRKRHQVRRFDADGALLAAWRVPFLAGVAVGRQPGGGDLVYVSDPVYHSVQVFDLTGTFLRRFGGSGDPQVRFQTPAGLGTTPDGNLIVTDNGDHRIHIVAPDGTPLVNFATGGSAPTDAAAREDGLIVVTGTGDSRLRAFAPNGAFQGEWSGSPGMEAPLQEPSGVAFSGSTLWVTDRAARRVVAFADTPPRFWHVRAYRDRSLIEGPAFVAAVDKADFDWGEGSPSPSLPADRFSIRVEQPVPEAGRYAISASVMGRATLRLQDGLFRAIASGAGAHLTAALDAGGLVRLDYMDPGGPAALRLSMVHLTEAIYLPLAASR